ncbi:MAG: bifunctional nuclease family protein [Tenuifilum sp.]|uniref:bifunctional nuclease domain-containing protein n=1 Tax=Tenuifilum TaxID=2760873 RepID=UPI001995E7E8|nr:bifunctional nuclease family protein [Bacteroidales bacterium]HOK62236.1 bifunctional nuclease family protein [Tenuifilum sp.]MBP7170665.1 bifunctional nuclease family protein [Bacteroidales bacterium]MBP9030261.1 bifunctional nuclease family protein [Bacteroidales bacterium]HOK86768.1 bifunctional nuclease family protein [Tenuifilum sp.]
MSKIKLTVLGISYSQTQSGAYALVLSEENGNRRIPIIIGGYEAQAIAIQLEGLTPPRPLTHDLFLNFARAFGIDLIDVHIYKLEDGVFFSKLHCEDSKKELFIDSRTSDAVALALRFNCPIYTTEEIIEKAGITLDVEEYNSEEPQDESETETPEPTDSFTDQIRRLSLDELNRLLSEAVENEEYEKATKIRDEIKRREKKK